MKDDRTIELKEVFQKAQKASRKIMVGLKEKLSEEKIDHEINELQTEIIIKNSSYEKIQEIVDEYAASTSLTSDSINMIISVTELDGIIVIRLKYA